MPFTDFHTRLLSSLGHVPAPSDLQFAVLEQFLDLLRKWNRTINLTSLQLDPLTEDSLERLFTEPIRAAQFVEKTHLNWFDLGSGGGSPAIPMKVVLPTLRLTMVESRGRKAAFLREAIRQLGLDQTSVENIRFEELKTRPEALGSVDLITVRAVRVDGEVRNLAKALLKPTGGLLTFENTGVAIVPRETIKP